MQSPDPTRDIGTTQPRFVERVLGGIPVTCPWAVFADPFVAEVIKLRREFERGAIDMGAQLAVLRAGVRIYDSALRRLEAHDDLEARKQREADARRREAEARGAMPTTRAVPTPRR